MKTSLAVSSTLLLGTLLFGIGLSAQTAVYQDNVLTIPQAVTITDTTATFYTDIQLGWDSNGYIELLSAQENPLTYVDSVSVNLMESLPIQVSLTVSGNKSIPCVKLLTPAIVRNEQIFTVVLAESVLGPAESCIQMLEPFTTSIVLDVAGLSAGTYTARVNGVDASFTLDFDN